MAYSLACLLPQYRTASPKPRPNGREEPLPMSRLAGCLSSLLLLLAVSQARSEPTPPAAAPASPPAAADTTAAQAIQASRGALINQGPTPPPGSAQVAQTPAPAPAAGSAEAPKPAAPEPPKLEI